MSDVDRANVRLVDHRSAIDGANVGAERLATRIGRLSQGDGTLAVRVARAIAALIDSGELRPGDRLPPERALAAAISVSRGTVVTAYGMLSDDGIVDRRQGSGTRVAGIARPVTTDAAAHAENLFAALPSAVDLLRAVPRMSQRAVEIVRAHAPGGLDPEQHSEVDPAGIPALRARIAELMGADGTSTTAAQILVTHGAAQALSLVVDTIVRPGDIVLTEAVTWPGLADSVRRRGGRVHGVGMGADGIDLDELEAAIVALRPVLVALNPHHHNPTATRVPPAGRRRIAELAAEYGVPVLEDRVLAHIAFDGVVPPTLASERPDAPIIVVDSLSKWSWPGLRLGWVRADPVLVRRLRSLRQIVDQSTSVPAQLMALDLLEHARELRTEVSLRHATAASRTAGLVAAHLPSWRVGTPRGGLSMWAQLPAGSATAFARTGAMHGVAVAGSREFMASVDFDDHIRIPYTAPDDVLEEGVRRLGRAWEDYAARL